MNDLNTEIKHTYRRISHVLFPYRLIEMSDDWPQCIFFTLVLPSTASAKQLKLFQSSSLCYSQLHKSPPKSMLATFSAFQSIAGDEGERVDRTENGRREFALRLRTMPKFCLQETSEERRIFCNSCNPLG